MADNGNKKKSDLVKTSDFEYTIVLDRDYLGESGTEAKDVSVKRLAPEPPTEHEDAMDRLYFEYEKLWMKSPTVIEKEDAYPRSYYWRLGGRYDPDKKPVLEEALATGKKIEYTEAYQRYVEKVKNVKFTPDSWD